MKKPSLVMLVLAVLGLAVAFYDSYAIYNGQALWCPPPINGCNEVANSPYARFFDLPVGYFGVVYYLYMVCLVALQAFDPFSRGLRLESVRRLYQGLHSFRNMMRMEASFRKARALRLRFSQSLASRRQRFNQAIVRSTIQRLGNGTNPMA